MNISILISYLQLDDMFTNKIRLALIITCLAVGTVSFFYNNFVDACLIWIGAGLFAYGYFRYSSVWLLFRYLRKGRQAKAEKLLNEIKHPELLTKQQMAYYFLSKAIIETGKDNFAEAETYYKQALQTGLRTSNDKSIAILNLANPYYLTGRPSEAIVQLNQSSQFPHKPEVDMEIQKLQQAIFSDTKV